MPQLKILHAETKTLHVATKTQCMQIKKKKYFLKKIQLGISTLNKFLLGFVGNEYRIIHL